MICVGNTDVGMVREVNQDTFILKRYSEKTCLCVVCDGMGGAKGGEEASRIASRAFAQVMDEFITPFVGQKKKGFSVNDVKKAMKRALLEANDAVYTYSRENPRLKGMGTTLVSALVIGNSVFCLNVGDSRMYFMKGNKIRQITKDHSYVQHLIDIGRITKNDIEYTLNKNIITRAVGTEITVDPDIYKSSVSEGTFILLCTDGLCNHVNDETICDIVSDDPVAKKIDEIGLNIRLRKLIDTANNNGGSDNITAAIIKV
ncbi:MAG: Stp1/IreP family PP2C-type Ser/Thr phosphatase [Ruminococcaceae bacterium]|nr:Stp1/IreP family PP2C-type Ser/Thr phosphatase [Oscillospiraceae bacterium]